MEVLKKIVPSPVRKALRDAKRRFQKKLLVIDALTDFAVLRRVTPYRRNFGAHRGQCIDRYYIEKFLAAHQADVHGHVLEIQTDEYTRQFGGSKVLKADILDLNPKNPLSTINADLAACPEIPDNTFDCVICTQTLLLIFDLNAAIAEVQRILKPNGVVLATLPGIAKVCEHHMTGGAGEDYWRFTAASANLLFSRCFGSQNVNVEPFGNVLSAVGFLHGLVTPELTSNELDFNDPEYQVLIGVRAVKATAP